MLMKNFEFYEFQQAGIFPREALCIEDTVLVLSFQRIELCRKDSLEVLPLFILNAIA